MTATKKTAPVLVATPATVAAPDPAPLQAWATAAADQFRGMGALIRALLLGLVCPRPTNLLILGPPGTAKTTVSVMLGGAAALRTLDVTLSPWTDAAELLGPVDLDALKRGKLERATSSQPTLADADLVNLDELPRAAPGIRGLTLRPLAERRLPLGAPIPAHLVVATANTRLTSEEDQALVDRMAQRIEVRPVEGEADSFHVLMREVPVDGVPPTAASLPSIDPALVLALRAHAATIAMPRDVGMAIVRLRETMAQPPPSGCPSIDSRWTARPASVSTGVAYPYVSPRRWIVATRLLQASAALAGRSAIDWSDLVDTLPAVFDDGAESRPAIRAAIEACVPRWVRSLSDLDAACTAAVERARRVGGVVDARKGDGDAHLKVEEEFDALLAPLRAYGAAVVERAESRLDAARAAVRDAYTEGSAAYAAHRKATR